MFVFLCVISVCMRVFVFVCACARVRVRVVCSAPQVSVW